MESYIAKGDVVITSISLPSGYIGLMNTRAKDDTIITVGNTIDFRGNIEAMRELNNLIR